MKPTVLLLGWGGATSRQLRVYGQWYEKRGFTVIPYIADVRSILRPARVQEDLSHFAQGLAGDLAADGPVIVHLFSNNGFIVYGWLLRHSGCGPHLRRRVVGHVMDSAPGLPEPLTAPRFVSTLRRAITPLLLPNNVPGWIGRTAVLLGGPLFWSIYYLMPRVQRYMAAARPNYRGAAPAVPLFAVYSPADAVVPAAIVDAFVREEQERGCRVEALRFEDSPHVGHWVHHRAAYGEALEAFVSSLESVH